MAVSLDRILKIKENEKRDKCIDLARELKKMKITGIPVVIGSLGSKVAGRVGNRRRSRDYPNYCIIEIGWKTETSPGDVRRLAVT